MLGLAHRGWSLNDYQQHIIHTLRKSGYHSTLIGMQHVASDPHMIGYDAIWETDDSSVARVAPRASEFLLSPPQQPFFLSVGFTETHRPFAPVPVAAGKYCAPAPYLPDTPETRQDMAAFLHSVRTLDCGIGMILEALERSGLADHTLVICTTDHGIAFPAAKSTLTDRGTGVMLIMRGPGGFSGGLVVDALISQLDIFPTICEVARVELPQWLQGRSLLPLLQSSTAEIHDAVFAEVTFHAAYEPQRSIRTNRYRYIRHFAEQQQQRGPVLANCDDSLSKDIWLAHGWQERPQPVEELYDLVFDPGEQRNLVADPDAASVLTDLRTRLTQWMMESHDPLLQGDVVPRPGAMLNDPTQLSPGDPAHRIGE
jgi:arylsulfatase A-like enzyme